MHYLDLYFQERNLKDLALASDSLKIFRRQICGQIFYLFPRKGAKISVSWI